MREKRISDLLIFLAAIQVILATFSLAALALFMVGWVIGIERAKILQDFLSTSSDIMISLLIIVGAVLVLAFSVMIVCWLSKDESGIMILPFELSAGEDKYNGKALSYLLTAELLRIQRIHKTEYEGITLIESENVYCPTIKPSSENISTEIAKIDTLEAGTASIPLGQILVSIKKLWPWGTNSRVISGCLQKYGSTISLMGCLEDRNMKTWEAKNINKGKKIGDEIIPELARDLAFMIVHYLSGKETNDKKITAKTWQAFKHFFGALEAYNLYNLSGNIKYLDLARTECLEAASSEMGYEKILKLLYNLGMEYSNKNELYKAEELLFQAYEIKQNDEFALVGLGHLYIMQRQYQKALDYFERAIDANKDSCSAWYNKGRALLYLGRNEEALKADERAIELNPEDAVGWSSKGAALIKLGKHEDALKACDKAIELDSKLAMAWNNKSFALDKLGLDNEALKTREDAAKREIRSAAIYTSLARYYRKLNKEADRAEACRIARNFIETDSSIYNHVCFEAVCGSPYAAIDLLRTALEINPHNANWARRDPDLEFIRDYDSFKDLLDEFSADGEKGPE